MIKSVLRFLFPVVVFLGWVALVPVTLRSEMSGVQSFAFLVAMLVVTRVIMDLPKIRLPYRRGWIGVWIGVAAIGVAVLVWVPRWSGWALVAAILFVFVIIPSMRALIAAPMRTGVRFMYAVAILMGSGALSALALRPGISEVQGFTFLALMGLLGSTIVWLVNSELPNRKSWIGVCIGAAAAGIAALLLLPQWSVWILGAAVFVPFVLVPFVRALIAAPVRTVVRLLSAIVVILYAMSLFTLTQRSGISGLQSFLFLAMMCLVGLPLILSGKNELRQSWAGVFVSIAVIGVASLLWVPQWSVLILVAAFVVLVLIPWVLGFTASRCRLPRTTAFYARLQCLFHPSKALRFQAALRAAEARGSTEETVAAYHALALHATPEEFALLNCLIPLAQDDWEGLLAQARNLPGAMSASAWTWFEVRALGELGSLDEMVTTFASAEATLPPLDLALCRLYILAFSGHIDSVRSLLSRRFPILRSNNRAYWIFVAAQAAGIHDEDARHALEAHISADNGETFTRRAQRRLAQTPVAVGDALSSESRATIAGVEEALQKVKRR